MRLGGLVAVVLLAGCFSETEPSASETAGSSEGGSGTASTTATETGTATASTSVDGSGSSGEQGCAGDAMCVDVPGEGWMGPFALAFVAAGEAGPSCAGAYDQPYGVPMHVGLVPGGIDCNCQCDQPPTMCVAEITKYESDAQCMFASSFGQNNLPGDCTPTSGVDSVDYLAARGQLPPCTVAMQGETTKEASGWEQDVVLCGLPEAPPPCESGACIPPPPGDFGTVCILHAGDEPCPGDFAAEHLVFVDVDDQRECDSCTCEGVAPDCTPIVYRATDMGCDDLDDGQTGCVDTTGPTIVATTWQPTAPAACEPVATVTGEVVGIGPHTLCCRG